MDFNEWYNEIVETADLCDKRYPVKGMNVWKPYGWKVMKNIDSLIHAEMDRTDHDEVCFPLLIPKTEFAKEADHIKGFDAEVYWVTHGGINELDVPMLLRPTSETAMYPLFSLWIRAHTDLPLKTYQIGSTFRYETKVTRAFIRVRQIHFFESHTAHVDYDDAEAQIHEDLEICGNFFRSLSLPYLLAKRPEWDKFAGAFYTIGIDALMPSGRTLQLGSVHHYKDNFAIPYDVKYEDENGDHQYVHQTTYGMSERVLGTVVGVHGDDRGIKLPHTIAPIQIVIIPIIKKDGPDVVAFCKDVAKTLGDAGLRARVDDRDLRPGNKYYHWEQRGVPIRLEIGPRDIDGGTAVMAVRDAEVGSGKSTIPLDSIVQTIQEALTAYSQRLLKNAEADLAENIHDHDNIQDADPKGIVKIGWCGMEECGHKAEDHLDMTMLGVWVDDGGEPKESKVCGVCGSDGHAVLFSKTY